MRIVSLYIEEFGGVKDRRVTFGEGLNLIEGDNESGKSTIWLFIKFMLYGLPRKGQEERERSVSRSGHVAKGTMTVTYLGEEYRIERSFADGSRLGREHCAVYRLSDGASVYEDQQPGEVFLGVGREIFDSSCGVGQMQCHRMGDKKSVDAIRNLLSSADETVDVTKILQRLDKVRVLYRHKTGKGGKLYDLHEQINRERELKRQAEENVRRKQSLEARLARTEAQWATNESDAERIRVALSHMNRLTVVRRFDQLRESEKEYASLQSQNERLRTESLKTEAIPTEMDVAKLRLQAEQLVAAQERTVRAEEARRTLMREASVNETDAAIGERLENEGGSAALTRRIDGLLRRKKRGLSLGVAGLVGAVLCGAVGALTALAVAFAAVLPLAVAVWGFVDLSQSGKALRALSQEYGKEPRVLLVYLPDCAEAWRRKRAQMDRMLRADGERDAAVREELICRQTLGATLARTLPDGEATAERAFAEAERIEIFLRETETLERRMHALRLRLDEEREALAQYEEAALRAQIPAELFDSRDEDFHRMEREQTFCAERRRSLDATRSQIRIELANVDAVAVSPMEIADRERTLTAESERAERYYDALVMAMDALKVASEQMSGTVTPRLGRDAGEMMSYITDGAYTEIRTGNELSPSLWNETDSPVPPELMSGGTRDAAYLSLRIALMMQIFERELPPLILDESLCSMDDRRMERMLTFLGKLSETRLQCLLFTCHKREAEACEAGKIPYRKIVLS